MRIIYNNNWDFKSRKTAVALGNFDGVHIGHISLINKIKEYAGLDSCVWTFSEHTLNVLKGGAFVPYITDNTEKAEIFRQENIDYLVFQDFDKVRDLPPEEFIAKALVDYLNAQVVVCGFDFKFGRNGSGNAELLKALLEEKNISSVIIEPVIREGQVVSSSVVRELIQAGDMRRAEKFLGRPFFISLPVIYGKQLGRSIGAPTINQVFPPGHIVPARGVYVCACEVDNKIYKAVANVGLRPTVKDGGFVNAETHIIDYDGDLYGENIKVSFYFKIRDEIKFINVEELRVQIKKDINFALGYNF